MYSDPKATRMYAEKLKIPEALVVDSVKRFQPKEALQSEQMADIDGAVRDAVKLKFLDKPLTREQLAELVQIPPR
jgi:NitT/TauT family transport system substrate-binding protein